MKIYDSSKGSMLIILILTITILSVLGAAMLSITTTSLYSELSFYNFNKANYYADSGIRYGKLIDTLNWNFDVNKYFTVFENGTILEIVQDSDPAAPQTINTAGFHIGITDCNYESTGVVNEDGIFEATRIISSSRGLPCWKFNSLTDNTLVDSCGNNRGKNEGTGISSAVSPYGIADEAWRFKNSSYVKTLFMPYCEIGDGVSFSISFWVKPDNNNEQTIFGVSGLDEDGNASSLTFGISSAGKKWEWAYGNEIGKTIVQAKDLQWQHIIIIFDNDDVSAKKVHYKIRDCPSSEEIEKDIPITGTAKFPYSNQYLYIGAENIDGSPGSYFTGEIDDLEIKKYEAGIADIDDLIIALSPSCP